jgi:subtilisin family serine protease
MDGRRVLVELRLPAGALEADALAAGESLAGLGLALDPDYPPVPVPAAADAPADAAEAETVVVRGTLEPGAEAALERDPRVVRIWSDARVQPFTRPCGAPDCNSRPLGAKGDLAAMAAFVGADRVWATGQRGAGITIGIVDTGVRGKACPALVDGWSPPGASPWGDDAAQEHGTMCAVDALAVCPEAAILDIGIMKSRAPTTEGFLSDAVAAYRWAMARYRAGGTPQILSNSWGMYRESWGPDYARDPNHPFTRTAVAAIGLGMLVVFAAGNCGADCLFPPAACGGDLGPGRSIWGANGHPAVITVAGANILGQWVGYSSQGPAALDPRKPDLCAPTHFKGFTRNDAGTSAATPVASGVLGLLRGARPSLRQEEAKHLLMETARDICEPGWDARSGAGIVQAEAAYLRLGAAGATGAAAGTAASGAARP